MKRLIDAALVAGAIAVVACTAGLLIGSAAAVVYVALEKTWPT